MQSAHLVVASNFSSAIIASTAGRKASSPSLLKLQNGYGWIFEGDSSGKRNRRRTIGAVQKCSGPENAVLLHGLREQRRSSSSAGIRPGAWGLDHGARPVRFGRRAGAAVRMALAVEEELETPSWDSLAERLEGKNFGPEVRISQAQERVFAPGQETKVVFYRDSWSWCPYCERVWLQLEEKQISYSVEKIDMSCYGEKPTWYKSMVPSGLLPAMKVDGELLTESMDIMKRLEEKFPNNNPLLPNLEAPEFAVVDELLELERHLTGAWINRLISSDGNDGSFELAMDRVNAALQRFSGPYFLGSEFSLVDVVYAPFLERISASMPYWLGIQVRGAGRWPALSAWLDAMDSRPSFQALKSDDFGIAHNLELQVGPISSSEAGAFYRALINGTHGSWDLPLKPETTAWGTDDGTSKGGAKEEAAQFLIANKEKNLEFALKGLNDGDNYRAAVDTGFRIVAQALLGGGVEYVDLPRYLPKEVAIAAAYLKDNVSVPRDLTYPAARQLRAHLQWLANNSGSGLNTVLADSLNQESGLNSWLYPSKDELPDEKEMTIFDHLEELRERAVVSVGAVGVAIVGCFFFAKDLIKILEAPVYSQGVRFLQLSPGEFFFTTLKVSGYCGLLIGSPVIIYEVIAFVLPGLTRSERRFLGPIVLGSSVLFYTGVVFSYIVLTPAALNFFVNYAEGAVESFWSIDQYFEFVLVLLFSTGLSFQVPVIQLLLGQTRLVSGDQMLSVWRYVVVGSVAAAAVLTPSTDPLTQMLLAFPLMGLYLGGAFLVKAVVSESDTNS
ncbi:unnamed protein product [Calypogeia fissa]